MLLYTTSLTPRLQYISDFIGKELANEPFVITTDKEQFNKFTGPKINYSDADINNDAFWLKPHTLLFQDNIIPQPINCFEFNGSKAFFKTEGDIPFDIFAASFYLLSRYEEYLPHQPDEYGRYDHTNSLAFKEDFLQLPLVNNWLELLKQLVQKRFPGIAIYHSSFTFLPTYDIDMAWSYKYKGWSRNTGGILRNLIRGQWKELRERIQVLTGKQKDPFDAFGWLNQLHEEKKLKPYYFFLLAGKTGRYDKNISPGKKEMKSLVADHIIRYPVGIHPSWQSGDSALLLKKEIAALAGITGNNVRSSRQHYIRMSMPETYRRLIDNGIQFDFSMGYGGINGFRASVASVFNWYDLQAEKQTPLIIFPFCYMEATSYYELKHTPQQALEEMEHYYQAVKSVNGLFSMIWHNSFLGTEKLEWREVYSQFLAKM